MEKILNIATSVFLGWIVCSIYTIIFWKPKWKKLGFMEGRLYELKKQYNANKKEIKEMEKEKKRKKIL